MTLAQHLRTLPLEIRVCVGRAKPAFQDLESFKTDTVIPLDRRVEDPVDLYVGETLIGQGELYQLEDGTERIGVRLTKVLSQGTETE